jgi:transcriptional regulator with PAS, ATPase and Fis domain
MPVQIITASPAMRRAVEMAERAAAAPPTSSLLITGETGTGKDLLAACVHERSGALGALVTIDCAALPEALLESELFGHERGAFTGATESRAGRFEAARAGTLVLDEVAALTPAAQAKLLRVLDERRFTRLGGRRAIGLEARVIALTNIELGRAIEAGTFRRDLFFRLNVVAIALPSLREQPEAIGQLAVLFAARFAHREPGGSVSTAALRLLERYEFPGNVRELRNVVEQAVIRSGGARIEPEHLPEYVTRTARRAAPRRATLAEVEADYILTILAESRGNKALAARTLGISRKNLYERLRRIGGQEPGVGSQEDDPDLTPDS